MRDWLCSHYYVPCAVLILLGFAGFLLYLARRVRMKDMIMITVLSAIIAISRGVFFWIPQFKPVSALVLITGSCFGSVPGMLVGMLSGFLSNFMFSQGPWTPFQMLSWGLIGIIGGFFRSMQGKILPMIIGFLATVFVYGPILNFASLLLVTNTPTWNGFWMMEASGFLFDVVHGVSTIVFVYFAWKPMRKKLVRMQEKYGICRRK